MRLPLLASILSACVRNQGLPFVGDCAARTPTGSTSTAQIGIGDCLSGPTSLAFVESGRSGAARHERQPVRAFRRRLAPRDPVVGGRSRRRQEPGRRAVASPRRPPRRSSARSPLRGTRHSSDRATARMPGRARTTITSGSSTCRTPAEPALGTRGADGGPPSRSAPTRSTSRTTTRRGSPTWRTAPSTA